MPFFIYQECDFEGRLPVSRNPESCFECGCELSVARSKPAGEPAVDPRKQSGPQSTWHNPVSRAVVDPLYKIRKDGHGADAALLDCGHLVSYESLLSEDLASAQCSHCTLGFSPDVGEVLQAASEPPGGRLRRALIVARRELAPMVDLAQLVDALA